MSERLLEIAIYGLSGLIFIILGWVFVREYVMRMSRSAMEEKNQTASKLFYQWLEGPRKKRTIIIEKIKQLGSSEFLEGHFFALYEKQDGKQKHKLKELYDILGIQQLLRTWLKESSDELKREEAVLKLAKVAADEDIPFLLDAFRDPMEVERVKACCVKAITEMAAPIIQEKKAVANLAFFVQLLDIPDLHLRKRIAHVLSSMSVPFEALIPHLIGLSSDTAKQGVLEVFRHWNRAEYAQILYDYLDDTNADIRKSALYLMGQFKDEKDILLLIQKLKDPNEQVRCAAVDALSNFSLRAVESHLFKHLNDACIQVQVKSFIYLASHESQKHFRALVSKLGDSVFQKQFLDALRQKTTGDIEKIFKFIGIDQRLFLKNYGWEAYDKFLEVYVETSKHSIDASLRKRALKAIVGWETKQLSTILKQSASLDPDEDIRAYAKVKLSDIKSSKGRKK